MIKKIILIALLTTTLIPQKQSWATTRFEKFWFGRFKQMVFRDPFTLTPFNFKIGYYQYGGLQYWNQWKDVVNNSSSLHSNPLGLNNVSLDDLSNNNKRQMVVAELDLFKYNFLHKIQNIVDMQIGFGYKFMKSLSGVYDQWNGVSIQFKPIIHIYNLNFTFIYHPTPKKYYHFFYSQGKSSADLYKSNSGDATGEGDSQSFGIGINFIKLRPNKRNYAHHGIELRFDKVIIDDVDDPLDNVNYFKTKQIGLMYSYAIGYGGNQSLGDEAFHDLINNNFISSIEKFKNFEKINKVKAREEDISEMIRFAEKQAPYQMYENALSEFENGYLEQALWWLNKAENDAPDDLIDKIYQQKIFIITELLKTDLDNETINEQINLLQNIRKYDTSNQDLNNKLSSLLIKKGNVYNKRNEIFKAYSLYEEALWLNPQNDAIVRLKYDELTIKILNNVYIFLQNNQNVIAYEYLSLLSEFSSKKDITEALYKISKQYIEDEKLIGIRERVQAFLYNRRDLFIVDATEVLLGDHYLDIVKILGDPIKEWEKRRFDNLYELVIYNVQDSKYRLFFKNKILIDVERIR